MIDLDIDAFSSTYALAREKFLQAAREAGLPVEQRLHPFRGPRGEDLAMDVVRDGPLDAKALLIVTSGCHGIEGFSGSAVQVAALRDANWRGFVHVRGVAVLYVHALNPWGFAHLRATTHENVFLDRNFIDFSAKLPANDAYRHLHPLLLPANWPPTAENQAAVQAWIASHGERDFLAAVTQGQYDFPDGLFYGGTAPSWSNRNWRRVLRQHARDAARLAWVDLHAGQGLDGVGDRVYAGPDDPAALARARRWWSGGGRTPVTCGHDGTAPAPHRHGLLWTTVREECRFCEYTGVALHPATVPVMELLDALRGDHWLHRNPDAPPAVADAVRQAMRDAFHPEASAWKLRVLEQAGQALQQAVEGLSA
ncbi:M14 family metallopeptidase [Ramlibacter sp. MAHUQ-53]|uniref:M14 family metallopeptidase n=1 Tax=unclassified Ramlibacter TaxID=2617605 RepID=UPI00364373C6